MGRELKRKKVAFRWGLSLGLGIALCGVNCGPARFEFQADEQSEQGTTVDGPVASDRNLRLGTRAFVAHALSDVFGGESNGAVNEAIVELVQSQLAPFAGGPCDRYGEDCPPSPTGSGRVDPAGESQASVVPVATTGRMALMIRACERIVTIDAAIQYAVSQVVGFDVGNSFPFPTEEDISSALELFSPGREPTSEVLSALDKLVRLAYTDGGAVESWRFLFLTLCSNPLWQIP